MGTWSADGEWEKLAQTTHLRQGRFHTNTTLTMKERNCFRKLSKQGGFKWTQLMTNGRWPGLSKLSECGGFHANRVLTARGETKLGKLSESFHNKYHADGAADKWRNYSGLRARHQSHKLYVNAAQLRVNRSIGR